MKIALGIALAVLLAWALLATHRASKADARAYVAEGARIVLAVERDSARAHSSRDSAAIVVRDATAQATRDSLDVIRAEASRRVAQAAQRGQRAADSLRVTLTEAQAVMLDGVVAAHAEEIAAFHVELAAADSATRTVEATLLVVRTALDSERQAGTARDAYSAALEAEREALRRVARPGVLARAWSHAPALAVGVLAGVLLTR